MDNCPKCKTSLFPKDIVMRVRCIIGLKDYNFLGILPLTKGIFRCEIWYRCPKCFKVIKERWNE